MKNQIFLLLFLSILQLSIISAYVAGKDGIDIIIKNDTIDAKSYIFYGGTTPYTKNLMTTNLISSFNCDSLNISNLTFGAYNETILTNCTYIFADKTVTINMTDVCPANETIQRTVEVNEETIINYTQCLKDYGILFGNHQYISNEYGGLNKTNELYIKCNADLAVCNTKQITIDDLNKQIEDMTNQKYVWGVVGLIAGIVGYMFYTGKIGGQKAKQAGENYQRGQRA